MALTDESNGNGFYMPVAPAYGGGNSNGMNGWGGDWAWIILLLLLAGNGGWGMGGFGGNQGGGSYRGGLYRGGSYARGRGRNAKRDSMGRYSSERGYSREDGVEEMVESIRSMMGELPQEIQRDAQKFVQKLEQMM